MARVFGTIVLTVISIAVFSPADAAPRRVLLLESYDNSFPPYSNYEVCVRKELTNQLKQPIDFFEASLATARYSQSAQDDLFAEYLRALFNEHPLDLTITFGSPAASFFEQHRAQLFPATPALLAAADERPMSLIPKADNDAAVLNRIDFTSVIKNILKVLPDTKNVAVIVGNSPIGRYWASEMQKTFEPFTSLQFTYLNQLSFEEIKQRAASLPPHSVIFFALLQVDGTGGAYLDDVALTEIHQVANAPIFSYIDDFFGMGIVGGPLLSVADLCHQATAAALRILGGEDPKNIGTIVVGSTTPVFDGRELERWKISEANLPPGSEVLFRPVTMWQQYRAQLLIIIAIVLSQAGFITALLIERRRRRLAELESRDRVLEVAHLNRTATAGAMAGAIAHELNQPLGAILSNTETAELLLEAAKIDHTQIKEILGDIRRDDCRAVEIIKGVRGFMKKGGRAAELDVREIDLNDAISEAAHILRPTAKLRGITLDLQQSRRSLPVRANRVHVQQVVLNLVLNGMDTMLERADADNIIVVRTTIVDNSEAMVSVADRGTGIPSDKLAAIFDPFYTTKPQGTGLGLSIAKSIVVTYGGKIWAKNGSEDGSIFCFTLPLAMVEAR